MGSRPIPDQAGAARHRLRSLFKTLRGYYMAMMKTHGQIRPGFRKFALEQLSLCSSVQREFPESEEVQRECKKVYDFLNSVGLDSSIGDTTDGSEERGEEGPLQPNSR